MDDTSDSLQFSEEDIRQQLDSLGYHNIPRSQLRLFAQDLERLIKNDTFGDRFSEISATSESDYSADDARIPSRYHQEPPSPSRRPASAPNRPRVNARHATSTSKQHQKPQPKEKIPRYPARHPQPFSYKYGETSTSGLDAIDDSLKTGRDRQHRRRSADKKPAMKRKVVRKMAGQVHVFDETITDSETDQGDLHDVSDRLSRLALPQNPRTNREGDELNDYEDDADTTLTGTDSSSNLTDFMYPRQRPLSSRDLYSHRPAGDENTVYKPHLPRSFIRPNSAQPRTKHDKKTDPVSRHQMYRAEWNSHRAPGEKNRNDLRWNIREQMMYKDPVVYPRRTPRVYSANNYVVPTDKKRQALRWAVRTSLAYKQMPESAFY